MLKVTAALIILGSFTYYVLFHSEEKRDSKTSRLLKEAEQSIASAETSVNKANSVPISYK
ncbi:hypothetical protein [Acinetobacter lactucae]|uniref:hypothetical protein n=1 Tax=Acinetobacter lactucae TaxID=1785128 RepID=UPI00157FDBDD|nr:hypothetical protein [Acinetobacter lactucae]NUF16682.1 hypothetical protein [Acinetobacter lactucae]NUG24603.1 hypothetical protein [Acinetobacter lactucae]